jgi:hypothetical protein
VTACCIILLSLTRSAAQARAQPTSSSSRSHVHAFVRVGADLKAPGAACDCHMLQQQHLLRRFAPLPVGCTAACWRHITGGAWCLLKDSLFQLKRRVQQGCKHTLCVAGGGDMRM